MMSSSPTDFTIKSATTCCYCFCAFFLFYYSILHPNQIILEFQIYIKIVQSLDVFAVTLYYHIFGFRRREIRTCKQTHQNSSISFVFKFFFVNFRNITLKIKKFQLF